MFDSDQKIAEFANAEKEFVRRGYSKIVRRLARDTVGRIFWYEKVGSPITQGSITFVDTGEKRIGVTANHVYHGPSSYTEAFEKNPSIRCQIEGEAFSPIQSLIDFDEDLDLATFEIPEELVQRIEKIFHSPDAWPPPVAIEGRYVIACGFPKEGRVIADGAVTSETFVQYGWIEAISSQSKMVIGYNLAKHVSQPLLTPPPQNANLGGTSGGPIFAVQLLPVWHWRLSGIITDFNSSDDSGLLMGASLNKIRSDGTFDRKVQ